MARFNFYGLNDIGAIDDPVYVQAQADLVFQAVNATAAQWRNAVTMVLQAVEQDVNNVRAAAARGLEPDPRQALEMIELLRRFVADAEQFPSNNSNVMGVLSAVSSLSTNVSYALGKAIDNLQRGIAGYANTIVGIKTAFKGLLSSEPLRLGYIQEAASIAAQARASNAAFLKDKIAKAAQLRDIYIRFYDLRREAESAYYALKKSALAGDVATSERWASQIAAWYVAAQPMGAQVQQLWLDIEGPLNQYFFEGRETDTATQNAGLDVLRGSSKTWATVGVQETLGNMALWVEAAQASVQQATIQIQDAELLARASAAFPDKNFVGIDDVLKFLGEASAFYQTNSVVPDPPQNVIPWSVDFVATTAELYRNSIRILKGEMIPSSMVTAKDVKPYFATGWVADVAANPTVLRSYLAGGERDIVQLRALVDFDAGLAPVLAREETKLKVLRDGIAVNDKAIALFNDLAKEVAGIPDDRVVRPLGEEVFVLLTVPNTVIREAEQIPLPSGAVDLLAWPGVSDLRKTADTMMSLLVRADESFTKALQLFTQLGQVPPENVVIPARSNLNKIATLAERAQLLVEARIEAEKAYAPSLGPALDMFAQELDQDSRAYSVEALEALATRIKEYGSNLQSIMTAVFDRSKGDATSPLGQAYLSLQASLARSNEMLNAVGLAIEVAKEGPPSIGRLVKAAVVFDDDGNPKLQPFIEVAAEFEPDAIFDVAWPGVVLAESARQPLWRIPEGLIREQPQRFKLKVETIRLGNTQNVIGRLGGEAEVFTPTYDEARQAKFKVKWLKDGSAEKLDGLMGMVITESERFTGYAQQLAQVLDDASLKLDAIDAAAGKPVELKAAIKALLPLEEAAKTILEQLAKSKAFLNKSATDAVELCQIGFYAGVQPEREVLALLKFMSTPAKVMNYHRPDIEVLEVETFRKDAEDSIKTFATQKEADEIRAIREARFKQLTLLRQSQAKVAVAYEDLSKAMIEHARGLADDGECAMDAAELVPLGLPDVSDFYPKVPGVVYNGSCIPLFMAPTEVIVEAVGPRRALKPLASPAQESFVIVQPPEPVTDLKTTFIQQLMAAGFSADEAEAAVSSQTRDEASEQAEIDRRWLDAHGGKPSKPVSSGGGMLWAGLAALGIGTGFWLMRSMKGK